MIRYRFLLLNLILCAALVGARWGSYAENAAIEKTGRLQKDFLRPLHLPFRDWKASDQKLSASELDLLQPDAVLVRRYQSKRGDMAEVAVIAGHEKRSVHTPAYCMPGGGWETLAQQNHDLSFSGRDVPAVRSLMRNDDGQELLVTYFFTDGRYATRNLVRFQGEQLLKRFRGEVPLGALVRIVVPMKGMTKAAAKLSDDFAQAMVPPVMEAIFKSRQEADGKAS